MDKEIYRILKEYNGLNLKKADLEKNISTEVQRIEKIEKQRALRLERLDIDQAQNSKHRLNLQDTENKISNLSIKLDKNQSDLNSIFTENELKSLNTQIETLKQQIETLEELGLEELDKIEELEKEIKNAETFLKGSLETIYEIEEEIKQDNEPLFNELKTITSRQKHLRALIPEKVLFKYQKLQEKKTPLTELNDKNVCIMCGYLVPKAFSDSVEKKLNFHTCVGCERIMIPQSSKYL